MSNSESIVLNGKTYVPLSISVQSESDYKDFYEYFCFFIDRNLEDAQYLYDDMKKEGLDIGRIEAEGYLRAFKQIANEINLYKKKKRQ